ncbi:MAG: MazG family protein, partial [Paludibacteraceae bacterium]|nr:MazG family protein [Paludibacteraceae bacterium]
VSAETPEDVERNWEALKTKEKGGNKRVLSGVPASLPSLIKAYRIQDKARNVGFDWEVREYVWKKVREEYEEVQSEIDSMDADKMTGEFGDLLFAIVNAARLYGVDPDNALERTNQKFIKRFNYIEDKTKEKGLELKDLDIDDMDELWDEAKSADC